MNKDNILYGIIGILVGVIVGYIGTNYVNRTYASSASPASSSQMVGQTGGQTGGQLGPANSGNLPPDHPPTGGATEGTTGGDASGGADQAGGPQAEVMDVIQQARKDTSNFDLQMRAGGMYTQIQMYEKSIEFYDRAVKIKPNDVDALVKLGNANFDSKRFEEAERWYQKALKINPNNALVRMDLGLTYYFREPRDLDKAIAEYRKVLSSNPRHEQTLQNLTSALIEKGDLARARETFKQLEAINPDPNNQALAQLRERLK